MKKVKLKSIDKLKKAEKLFSEKISKAENAKIIKK